MLVTDVDRYLALRQSLGFKMVNVSGYLRAFARYAVAAGDTHLRAATVVSWAATASTPGARYRRLQHVARMGRFLRAENPIHEVVPTRFFAVRSARPTPYIFTPEEMKRILDAAYRLRPCRRTPLRRQTFVTLLGLIVATGLRVSEALNLRVDDLLRRGVLRINNTKFAKSRLVPLHETVLFALNQYLDARQRVVGPSVYMFATERGNPLPKTTVTSTFWRILRLADIAPGRSRRPRIHDMRHTFATRVLEQSAVRREAVGRHFVALATYLGHAHTNSTYWYLQATPELMADIAVAAEALVAGEIA